MRILLLCSDPRPPFDLVKGAFGERKTEIGECTFLAGENPRWNTPSETVDFKARCWDRFTDKHEVIPR
jgi:hypothetical protein